MNVVVNRIMKRLIVLLLCMFMSIAYAVDEVLYWMVEEDTVVHYQDRTSQHMSMLVPENTDSSLAARVRVVGGNLTEDTFLNLYAGNGEVWDASMGIDFGDFGSGYWGCGVPVGNQAPMSDFASPEFSFIMEIGNYNWNDDNWTTVASSASQSYNSLAEKDYIHYAFDLYPPSNKVWSPKDFYAPVPEPNTGLLILIGVSMLALKRGVKA